jgi:ATP-binding cassette, subfamily B, multidrug efflux pump
MSPVIPTTPLRLDSTLSWRELVVTCFNWLRPFKARLLFGFVMILLSNIAGSLLPLGFQQVLQQLEGGAIKAGEATVSYGFIPHAWLALPVSLLALALLQCVGRVLSRLWLLGTARRVEVQLRKELAERLLSAPLSFWGSRSAGDMLSRLSNDLTAIRYLLGGGSMLASNSLLAFATRLPLMFMLNAKLTVMCLLLYPLGFYVMAHFSTSLKVASLEAQKQLGRLSHQSHQAVHAWQSIRANQTTGQELDRFHTTGLAYQQANKAVIAYRIKLALLMIFLSGGSLVILLAMAGPSLQSGEWRISQLVAFALYLEQLAWPALSLGWLSSMVQQGHSALARNQAVLQAPQEKTSTFLSMTEAPKLEVRDLAFTYQSDVKEAVSQNKPTPQEEKPTGAPVLQHLSFSVPAGSLTVLMGAVGSGKSTLLKVLAGLYKPQAGEVLVNDVALKPDAWLAYRENVAYLPQVPYLFSLPLATMLSYSRVTDGTLAPASSAELKEALEQVGLWEEVCQWPQGLQTPIGSKGWRLSGGQRQRLLLALCLLSQRPLWLLDDPFSSVDGPNEQALIAAIQALHQKYRPTLIISTHRPSILPYASQVIRL